MHRRAPTGQPESRLAPARARRIARIAGLALAAWGVVAIAGWLAGVSILAGHHPLKFSSAVSLLLAGAAIATLAAPETPQRRRLGAALATALGALALADLLAWVTGHAPRLISAGPSGWAAPSAPLTAVCMGALGACVGLYTLRRESVAQALGAVVVATSIAALVGQVYGVSALHRAETGRTMSAQAAVAILVAAAASLLLRTDRGIVARVAGGDPAASEVRRLLVPAIGIPAILGTMAAEAVSHLGVSVPVALGASTLLTAAGAGVLAWIGGERVHALHARAASAEDAAAREARDADLVRLLRSVAVAANEADDLEGAARLCLAEVCRYTGWPVGHVWKMDDETNELVSAGIWHLEGDTDATLRRVSGATPLREGFGLPGLVWASGSPMWVEDVAARIEFPRVQLAEESSEPLGVHGAFAFPVTAAGRLVAVLEFYSDQPQPRDEEFLGIGEDMGRLLGRVAERAWASRLLRESEERVRRVIDTAGDAFVAADLEGTITDWNRQAAEMFGWEASEALGRDLATTILPARLRQGTHTLQAGLGALMDLKESGREELTAVDRHGREFPVEVTAWALHEGSAWSLKAFIRDVSERHEAQRAQAALAALVETSDDAIITTDLEGTILTWNNGAQRLYGYPADDVVGANASILVPPGEPPNELEGFLADLTQGRPIRTEVDRLRSDGSVITLSLTISPIRDERGRVVATAGISRDITARKRSEDAHARLAAIVESSDDAIIGQDLEGTVLAWNRGAQRLYGYTAEEMIGQSMSRLAPKDRIDEHLRLLRPLRVTGSVQHLETLRMRKDGSMVDVSIALSPVTDAAGRLIGASTIARDITDRRWAEEALRESEERFRLALVNAPIGIALVALDGRWLQVNPALCAIVGLNESDLVGRPSATITHPDDVAADQHLVEQLLSGEIRTYQVEKRYRHADGHMVWILLSVSLVRDPEGQPRYFIAQIEDMSDRKRTETELRETNELLRSTLAESKRQWRELSMLNEMGDMLLSCATVQEANEVIARFSGRLFPSASGALLRPVPPAGTLEEVAAWGDVPAASRVFTFDDCWALRRGKVHRVLRGSHTVRCSHLDSGDTPSTADWSVCIPLMAQGEVLGLLHLNGRTPAEDEEAPSPEAVERLGITIAEHLSLAIANIELRERLGAPASPARLH